MSILKILYLGSKNYRANKYVKSIKSKDNEHGSIYIKNTKPIKQLLRNLDTNVVGKWTRVYIEIENYTVLSFSKGKDLVFITSFSDRKAVPFLRLNMHETRTSISSEIKATKDMHYFVLYPEQTFSIGKLIIGCLTKRLNSKWYNTIKNINL